MTTRDRQRKLDFLLAQGGVAGPEHERILERVLADVRSPPRRRLRPWWALMTLAGAAGAIAIVAVTMKDRPEFRARGEAAGIGNLEIRCSAGTLEHCQPGSSLLFEFRGVARGGFVTAFAEPSDSESTDRIWYFVGPAAVIRGGGGPELLRQVVRLGPEHRAGTYRIRVLLSERPLSRDEALRPPAVMGSWEATLAVVK
jgi:hypothetical protein